MKIVLTAFALLTATLPASAYDICAPQNMPPFHVRTPTVRTDIYMAPAEQIVAWCHKDPRMQATVILNGCTYQASTTRTGHAIVILSDALDDHDRACVLTYEFSHLPPNNWQDPVMEATAPNDSTVSAR